MSSKRTARISNIDKIEKAIEGERKELKQNKKSRKKNKKIRKTKQFFIFNFCLGTICFYVGLFIIYGPQTTFRNWFITTAEASMRHKYYARWFYDEDTIAYVMSNNNVIETNASTDTSLYQATNIDEITKPKKYKNEYERQILERDPNHLDYKIIEFNDEKLEKTGRTFDGFLAVIYDASKIHTVTTQYLGTRGEYLVNMAKRVNAQVAINGGGFVDPNFNSNGATPLGLTITKGKVMSSQTYRGAGGIIGFNEDDQLILTKCSQSQAQALGIRDCVTFGPFLIVNGEPSEVLGNGGWGVAPRTVIGQRADGIVLFLVIDGRSGLKQGVDMNDLIELMQRYDAINAANLDGGTSSVMIVDGELINDPIDSTGAHKTRWISTGFYLESESE